MFRPARIVNGLTQAGQSIVSLGAVAGLLLSFHWGITVILLIAAIPGLAVRIRYADRVHKWDREVTETRRRAWYLNSVLTENTYAKELRLFGAGAFFSQLYKTCVASSDLPGCGLLRGMYRPSLRQK